MPTTTAQIEVINPATGENIFNISGKNASGNLFLEAFPNNDIAEVIAQVLKKGELVSITDGPFKDFEGKVSEIDQDRGKVRVLVSMFGRETPVELDFLQVARL